MMSVHKASTAPGARMLSDIFPPFGCGALTIRPREGDARAERSQCKKAISALQRRDEILRPADDVAIADDGVERVPARLALIERHVARGPQCAGEARKSVVEGTSVAVRVVLGGRRVIKKKKQNKNEH